MVKVSPLRLIHGIDVNSNPLTTDYIRDKQGTKSPLLIADNAVLGRQQMVGNRRGFTYFTATTTALVTSMFEYQGFVVEHQGNDNTLWYSANNNGTRTQIPGSFKAISGQKMDSVGARGSFFFATQDGPYKLDTITNTPARAGLAKGLDVRITTTGTGGGFMNGSSKVAYHITWLRTDANNQQVRSDVSSRIIITNLTRVTASTLTQLSGTATFTSLTAHGFTTGQQIVIAGATPTQYNGTFTITVTGGTTFTYAVAGSPTSPATGTITAELQLNTSVTFTAPADVASADQYEVWRTITVDAASPDPGDTCFLVARAVYGGAAFGTVTYADSTADSVLQTATPLYTNATLEGATAGNTRPPLCTTMTVYKDYSIYGNTSVDQQTTVNMLSTTSFAAGFATVVLTRSDNSSSRTYTGNTTESIGAQQWQIFTGGISAAANIKSSSQSLCRVINQDSSGFWYAEYTSDANPNNNPGIIRLWARTPSTGSFFVKADSTTTGNQFTPALPTSGNAVLSSGDARVNRLFFSKLQQPDHVPLVNFIDVGDLTAPIRRVLAVRDAFYVITDAGVFYYDGLAPPFAPHELDRTCHILAPWSAATVNNQIFMLSNQGVVQLSSSGVTVISLNIDPLLAPLLSLTSLATATFGVAHESQRHYLLWMPVKNSDTFAMQCFVFHTFFQEWTKWTKPAAAGIALNSNFTLYLSSGQENAILSQRSNNDNTDYSDEELAITINSQSGTTLNITWTNGVMLPTAGMSIHQSTVVAKTTSVTLVSGSTYTVTLDTSRSFANGAATARMPIAFHARTAPNICNDSGTTKQFYSVEVMLERNSVTQASLELGTNEGAQFYTYLLTRNVPLGFGQNPWGQTEWGDTVSPVQSVPWSVDIPTPDNTGETITFGLFHNVSQESFYIAQADIFYDDLAEYETAT